MSPVNALASADFNDRLALAGPYLERMISDLGHSKLNETSLMEAATDNNENPNDVANSEDNLPELIPPNDVANSDDDLPELVPEDELPDHLVRPGKASGRNRNVPQGMPIGIGRYLILEELIISYDFAYDFVFRVPVRPSVSAPPVLVEQCAACLLAGQEFAHQGNIFRRTDRLRGEYLEWEPCREPLVHPPRLQRAKL
ncbi:hypothetical protein B0H13DRAFT_2346668 [Mycena leptocephala]|nr:hypothetical protein B0H13DRAFT_2346668 [Mycena leptocephala]